MTTTSPVSFDRAAVLERFSRIRARTRALFEVLDESVYYERPIALRNPVVFYEGHLPVFAVNTLIKKGLGGPAIDEHLEEVFARGIDPESEASAVARGNPAWPSRQSVLDYAAAADRRIKDAIAHADLDRDDHPLLLRAQALWTILEHEEMHQETLAYMWHQVPHARKQKPAGYVTLPPHHVRPEPIAARVVIPEGDATLGTDLRESAFGWDNERPAHVVSVDAFTIDVYNVTNAEFLEFVDAGGYREPRLWREEDWAWIASEGISTSAILGRSVGGVAMAGDVRVGAAACGLARLCHMGGSAGVCVVARVTAPERSRVSPRGLRDARWRRTAVSMGQRPRRHAAGELRFRTVGPRAR